MVGGDFCTRALSFGAPPLDGIVDGDVVFKRVGARDIVIVGIFRPPDNAARLIFLAEDRLELHFDKTVFKVRVVLDANRIRGLTRLLQDVRFARRGVVPLDRPLRFAGAGFGRSPAGRWCANREVVEVEGLRERRAGRGQRKKRNYG